MCVRRRFIQKLETNVFTRKELVVSMCVEHNIQQTRFYLKKNLLLFFTRIVLFERKRKNPKEIREKLRNFYPTETTHFETFFFSILNSFKEN